MNKAWGSENFPVSSIAEMLGMEYINELENYIDGVAEPSIPFLERFCERFGVCPEWLKHGRLAPFTVEHIYEPLECLERIRALKPEWIFSVRSRDPRGEVGIVAKIADKKYVTFRGHWVISSQVGAGGARRMYDFYKLIKELRDGELRCYLTGRLYNANDFNSLFGGECYPGFVEKPGRYNMHWWDDFADTGTSHLTREQLEEYWGREFVLAQDIVLAKVRDCGPSEVKKGS